MKKYTLSKADYYRLSSPSQEKAWIKQFHAMYGGLIGIGVVIIQPFLSSHELEGPAAKICVFSFAIAIPLLAALLLLNFEEDFRARTIKSALVEVVKVVGQLAAVVGLVAGFWHIDVVAGIGMLVATILGLAAYSTGYKKLLRKRTDDDTWQLGR